MIRPTPIVYFIYAPTLKEIVDDKEYYPIKIGKSHTWAKERLAQLQCGCPVVLEIYRFLIRGYADILERHFHKLCKEYQIRNEWFRLTFAQVDALLDIYEHTSKIFDKLKIRRNNDNFLFSMKSGDGRIIYKSDVILQHKETQEIWIQTKAGLIISSNWLIENYPQAKIALSKIPRL